MTDSQALAQPKSARVTEVVRLLRRYPELAPAETSRLVAAFRGLTLLDAALLTTDESLRVHLDRFRHDHRRKLRPPLGHYLLFLAVPVTVLAALTWGLWRTAIGG
jgi:hypothetical protein